LLVCDPSRVLVLGCELPTLTTMHFLSAALYEYRWQGGFFCPHRPSQASLSFVLPGNIKPLLPRLVTSIFP